MFVNTTATVVYVTELFVSIPGVVIGGWVGFALFIVFFLATLGMGLTRIFKYTADLYELLGYTLFMVVVYLLAATEQFVFARSNDDDVTVKGNPWMQWANTEEKLEAQMMWVKKNAREMPGIAFFSSRASMELLRVADRLAGEIFK